MLKGRPGPADKKLTPVVAMVERQGRIRLFPVNSVNYVTMREALVANIDAPNAHLMTDELPVYPKTAVDAKFRKHEVIRHMDKQYVRGSVYTNTVEGFSACSSAA